MNEHVLIVHGGWHQSDGRDTNGVDALYELPNNLIIKTYGAQGTALLKTSARVIFDELKKRGQSLNLSNGRNTINTVSVEYKEYKSGRGEHSTMISNYSLSGETNDLLGLFLIDGTRIRRLDSGFKSHLKEFIEGNNISGMLHLLCCQEFD